MKRKTTNRTKINNLIHAFGVPVENLRFQLEVTRHTTYVVFFTIDNKLEILNIADYSVSLLPEHTIIVTLNNNGVGAKKIPNLETIKRFNSYRDLINRSADEFGVPHYAIKTLLYIESRYRNDAVSWTLVRGMAQITGMTRKAYGLGKCKSAKCQIRGMCKIVEKVYANLPDYYSHTERMRLTAYIYNRGKGSYFYAKRKLQDRSISVTDYKEMLVELSKVEYNHEGLKYIKSFKKYNKLFDMSV